MQPFGHSGGMPANGDPCYRGPTPVNGGRFRSLSRNSNPGGHRLGDRFPPNYMQRRPSDPYQNRYQTYGDQEEDFEDCRPRGSTIGDFDQDNNFGFHRRVNSFPGNNMYGGYVDPYGIGPMSASPRDHMMRAQMMRGSMYGMDPMMGRMGLGGGYGGMYGGPMGYGMGGSMLGPGSAYGAVGPRPMMGMGMGGMGMGMGMQGMGMGGMMGAGYPGVGIRPYRTSGFVDSYSPHLMRAKTWSAYGRIL